MPYVRMPYRTYEGVSHTENLLSLTNINIARGHIEDVKIRMFVLLQVVAACCSMLQCAAVCCSGLAKDIEILQTAAFRMCVLQVVAMCCSVMSCVAVCCGVLQ